MNAIDCLNFIRFIAFIAYCGYVQNHDETKLRLLATGYTTLTRELLKLLESDIWNPVTKALLYV